MRRSSPALDASSAGHEQEVDGSVIAQLAIAKLASLVIHGERRRLDEDADATFLSG